MVRFVRSINDLYILHFSHIRGLFRVFVFFRFWRKRIKNVFFTIRQNRELLLGRHSRTVDNDICLQHGFLHSVLLSGLVHSEDWQQKG